jgi:hypothetical protein
MQIARRTALSKPWGQGSESLITMMVGHLGR